MKKINPKLKVSWRKGYFWIKQYRKAKFGQETADKLTVFFKKYPVDMYGAWHSYRKPIKPIEYKLQISPMENDSIGKHLGLTRTEDVELEETKRLFGSSLEEARLAKKDLKKPWTINGSQWMAIQNIHEPWIAEISPIQYARMSKRAQAAYDKKRSAEWQASGDAKQTWEKAVIDAYNKGKFNINDRDVHRDAKSAISSGKIRAKESNKKAKIEKAHTSNRISSTSEVKVGDRVYYIIYRKYADVVKVNKKTVRIKFDDGSAITKDPNMLQWLSHNDVESQAVKENVERNSEHKDINLYEVSASPSEKKAITVLLKKAAKMDAEKLDSLPIGTVIIDKPRKGETPSLYVRVMDSFRGNVLWDSYGLSAFKYLSQGKYSEVREYSSNKLSTALAWGGRKFSIVYEPSSNKNEDVELSEVKYQTFYFKGDKVQYTGKSEIIYGGMFYEFVYMEGHKKGKIGHTPNPPFASNKKNEDVESSNEYLLEVDDNQNRIEKIFKLAKNGLMKLNRRSMQTYMERNRSRWEKEIESLMKVAIKNAASSNRDFADDEIDKAVASFTRLQVTNAFNRATRRNENIETGVKHIKEMRNTLLGNNLDEELFSEPKYKKWTDKLDSFLKRTKGITLENAKQSANVSNAMLHSMFMSNSDIKKVAYKISAEMK